MWPWGPSVSLFFLNYKWVPLLSQSPRWHARCAPPPHPASPVKPPLRSSRRQAAASPFPPKSRRRTARATGWAQAAATVPVPEKGTGCPFFSSSCSIIPRWFLVPHLGLLWSRTPDVQRRPPCSSFRRFSSCCSSPARSGSLRYAFPAPFLPQSSTLFSYSLKSKLNPSLPAVPCLFQCLFKGQRQFLRTVWKQKGYPSVQCGSAVGFHCDSGILVLPPNSGSGEVVFFQRYLDLVLKHPLCISVF